MIPHNLSRYTKALFVITMIGFAGSCSKYLDVPPPTNKITESVAYSNKINIESAMTGLYAACFIDLPGSYGGAFADTYMALVTDDASTLNAYYSPFYTNIYPLANSPVQLLYNGPYYCIGNANGFIESITNTTVISEAEKIHYIAQAKVMRAYYYFILTNLYGDVAMPVGSNYQSNALLPRIARASVDSLIMSDLTDAKNELTPDEGNGAYTFNQNTVNALLARMYGYKKDWVSEEAAATAVMESGRYSLAEDPGSVFFRGSPEAIYQVPNSGTGLDGIVFAAFSGGVINSLTPSLTNLFEPGDLRKSQWMRVAGTNVKFNKYQFSPVQPQEQVPIRLADVILLRAEARAQQNDLNNAIDDINLVRERAGVDDLPYTLTQGEVIQAMMDERRKEFFAEDITRWFDLNRWGLLQSTMSAAKPTTWTAKAELFPVTTEEMAKSPNLKQTVGY